MQYKIVPLNLVQKLEMGLHARIKENRMIATSEFTDRTNPSHNIIMDRNIKKQRLQAIFFFTKAKKACFLGTEKIHVLRQILWGWGPVASSSWHVQLTTAAAVVTSEASRKEEEELYRAGGGGGAPVTLNLPGHR
ncbi:hypothetical protein ACJX0J_027617 [Zea mays]